MHDFIKNPNNTSKNDVFVCFFSSVYGENAYFWLKMF